MLKKSRDNDMSFRTALSALLIWLLPLMIAPASYADETEDCGPEKFITLPNPFVLRSGDLFTLEECRSALTQALSAYITPLCSEVLSLRCRLNCVANCYTTNPPPNPPPTPPPPPGEVGFGCGSSIPSPHGVISLNPCRITFKETPRIAVLCKSRCPQGEPETY